MHIYIDEAGRGPLAGPVYVGIIVDDGHNDSRILQDYRDSKKIPAQHREYLFDKLEKSAIVWSYGKSTARYIDTYGIVAAIRHAIVGALKRVVPEYKALIATGDITLHIDGNTDFGLQRKFPGLIVHTYIKGDDRIASISAASIVAKVLRDKEMIQLDKKHPCYGFAQHKGYGTKMHRNNIVRYGLSQEHRKSFCTRI